MKLNSKKEILAQDVERALSFSYLQILRYLPEFTEKFPKAYSEKGFYYPIENNDWTNGFWTGELWLAYEFSQNDKIREVAEIQVESFLDRINKKIEVNHHDMGFLYSPSCVAAYKLTGNQVAKEAALKAADQLLSRFQEKGGFIQAWGTMNAPENYRLIIDCLLNLPLLFWAAEVTGADKYGKVARRHIKTSLENVIRDDYSTWHTFYFDMESGVPQGGETCQGYCDDSAWARGQAWGIYGTALGYKYVKDKKYIELFEGVTHYFLEHLPEDLIPYWDLEFTDGADQPRDSSAASIAACGMLEMAKYLDSGRAKRYTSYAKKIMKSIFDSYAVMDHEISNGLVLHSTYSNHSPYNTCNHYGVDECNIWGDYFYMEALMRLYKDWDTYW